MLRCIFSLQPLQFTADDISFMRICATAFKVGVCCVIPAIVDVRSVWRLFARPSNSGIGHLPYD